MGTDPTQRSQRAEEGFEQARGVYPSPRMKGTGRLFLQFHPFRFDLFCRPLWRICAIRNGIEAEISFVSCVSPDFPRENPLPCTRSTSDPEAGRMKSEKRRVSKAQ